MTGARTLAVFRGEQMYVVACTDTLHSPVWHHLHDVHVKRRIRATIELRSIPFNRCARNSCSPHIDVLPPLDLSACLPACLPFPSAAASVASQSAPPTAAAAAAVGAADCASLARVAVSDVRIGERGEEVVQLRCEGHSSEQ